MSINVKTGDIIGIYKVLGDSTKSVDGHKRLRVKCIVCGLEKDIRPVNLGATVCNHKQKIVVKNCEFCGKPIPYTSNTRVTDYNRRRFCSVSCAAKINNKRLHSDDSKLKAAKTQLLKRYGDLDEIGLATLKASKSLARSKRTSNKYFYDSLVAGQDFVVCPYCNLRFGQITTKHLKLHNKSLDDLFNEFGKDYKVVSDKTYAKKVEAGRAVQQQLIENGTHKGWQSRRITSYAEKFWQQVLDNNNIAYEREFLVVNNKTHYFLDFRLIKNNKVIDLEIDGKQHTYEDRIASDKVRDEILQGLDYIIYRIP